ncbi:MAG: metallophosphoesterase [Selenomonas sp.]|uniref:metallophosphoesterase n=1 Tax=Selenomonas sp. TaxID=2053611 RepID=UPI0025E3812B|nr:metallophosphoesterase [Selenomonas sp.]MCR5758137.1 metallophosphoesterase [Selenomonas sp.]
MFWAMVITFLAVIFFIIPTVFACIIYRKIPVDKNKRRFLKGVTLYPAAMAGGSAYGYHYERKQQVKRYYDVKFPQGKALSGLTLAQISDVHLGKFFSLDNLRNLLKRVAEDEPDILVVTGDLFDDVEMNPAAAQVLDEAVDLFPKGIYFAIGNHEYYRNWGRTLSFLKKTRVHILVGRAEKVPGTDLWLAGAEYSFARDDESFEQEKAALTQKAVKDIPQEELKQTILLAHHPEFIDDGAALGIPLTLTGHTHGGQLGIFGLPVIPAFKYTRGLVKNGDSLGYVHCGNGSWLPIRVGCPPEIAYFRIRP